MPDGALGTDYAEVRAAPRSYFNMEWRIGRIPHTILKGRRRIDVQDSTA
jgi:hypothetical protein